MPPVAKPADLLLVQEEDLVQEEEIDTHSTMKILYICIRGKSFTPLDPLVYR